MENEIKKETTTPDSAAAQSPVKNPNPAANANLQENPNTDTNKEQINSEITDGEDA